MGVSIRDCRVDDIEQVLSIWETSGAGRTPTDNVQDVQRAIAQPQLEFLVAEVDGRVVGTIMGGFDGWRAGDFEACRRSLLPAQRNRPSAPDGSGGAFR